MIMLDYVRSILAQRLVRGILFPQRALKKRAAMGEAMWQAPEGGF